MAKPPITSNVHQPLDIHGHFTAKVSLNLMLAINDFSNADHLGLFELIDTGTEIDISLCQDLLGGRSSNTVNVCQGDFNPFVIWQVNTSDSCHPFTSLFDTSRFRARDPSIYAKSSVKWNALASNFEILNTKQYRNLNVQNSKPSKARLLWEKTSSFRELESWSSECSILSLPLFMLGVLTNDPKDTFSLNNLAFVADSSDGAFDLHRLLPFYLNRIIRPPLRFAQTQSGSAKV